MGGFGNFAVSFSVISVLTGAVTLYGHGLRNGGPFEMLAGWPLVTLMTLPVALSLAQLASSYPTAGALYHWSSILGGRGWGFGTAWMNLLGQVAVTAGVDYGLADFLRPVLGLPEERAPTLALFAAILVSHGLLNHLGVRAVELLNLVSAWHHLLGTLVVVAALAFFAPHQPAAFMLTRVTTAPQGYFYGFLIGLLQAQWTYTGYDASAHVTEETVDPARNAPRGIILSVLLSGLAGYALLIAVTLAISDLPAAMAAENPFLFVLHGALGGRLGDAMAWIVIGAMWFCGLSSITSNSRMIFAFARDGGLPGSARLSRVSERFKSPHIAIWVSVLGAFVVALYARAYDAMTALSTIALYASYGMPIIAGLLARRSGTWTRRGPWDLGRFSAATNVLALAWTAFIMVLFVFPLDGVARVGFALFIAALLGAWFGVMRRSFIGPPQTTLETR
ncbi:MAG: amino acid permease [Deltaproteobacteria bacterium]|nr:amino acid permease [Deltaproteobacteria bacterium]